jgi:hypothetical protein
MKKWMLVYPGGGGRADWYWCSAASITESTNSLTSTRGGLLGAGWPGATGGLRPLPCSDGFDADCGIE